jgi:hypothetical protein
MKQAISAVALMLGLVLPLYYSEGYALATVKDIVATDEAEIEDKLTVGQPDDEVFIDYDLPFPGMLPDNPLYPLKTLRDRILEVLIRDPDRKVEFYLLMADKRLNMGIFLADKDNHELAEETVSKGGKFFFKGVEEMRMSGVYNGRYKSASFKHMNVIRKLQNKAPENIKKGYDSSIKVLEDSISKLSSLEN